MKTIVLTEKTSAWHRDVGTIASADVRSEGEWLMAHRNLCRPTLRADDFW